MSNFVVTFKVQQQASAIEKNTGLTVIRRSGNDNEFKRITWSSQEICVCTPAIFLNAIKLKQIAMSQLSLLIFDEVHEANSSNSPYGLLLPYLSQCPASKRPRVLGLTASPCSNSSDMRQSISSLCDKLLAVPYTPLHENSIERPNRITCNYISIHKTSFETEYENFVIEMLDSLSDLHNFFEANWKKLPTKLRVEIKIDAISKIITHARLFGQDQDDIQLLQLTTWMVKWLDSLNILQILGPIKLVQLVRADLDYAEKNKDLSKISSQLEPIINQLRHSVEKLFAEHKIDDNSPRLAELLSILKRHRSEHERILIFVERRNTADRLCRRLKEDVCIKEMNPIFVVGNTNGGSACKEMQQNILEMFRSGECQLLVATSVLEQGIDVAMCGLVICFDGVKSVKSIIQSRGRARKDSAVFVAFVAADKQRKANELFKSEITMDYTVHQLMVENICTVDYQRVVEEFDKFLLSDDRRSEDYSVMDESDDDNDENEEDDQKLKDGKTIKLRFLHFVNSSALIEHLKSFDRYKATKRYIDAYFTVSDDENISKIIKEISTVARDTPRLRSWIEITVNFHGSKENNFQLETVAFDSLTGFYFEDFTTVRLDSNVIWPDAIQLKIHNNEMKISRNDCQFHFHATNVEAILINDTNLSFEIYLCLRNPPAYFIDKELAHFDFVTRSFNLCLQRKTSVDCSTSWKLLEAFHSFTTNIIYVCHLRKSIILDDGDSDDCVHPLKTDFMTDYLIKVWHSTHSALLPAILPKRILKRFYGCSSLTALKLLLNNATPVRFQHLEIKNTTDVQLPFTEYDDLSEDYVLVCRVNVTPTRFIYLPMQSVQKNRVLRYYPDAKNFLLISFTDENGGNPWRSTYIYEWFLNVLRNGIKICGKTFTFLGCSNSQLREGRCWFSSLNRDEVYDKIGEFPDTWSAGRKLTRLALAFASSFETVVLDHERYLHTVANDVEVNGVNFSDGIGRVSQKLAKNLEAILNLSHRTSAFQIRVGGIKGVISVYYQEDEVTFRKSMKKFESTHNMLEVLNYSRSLNMFLNRHVILLLSSFGISDDIFLEMQHKVLMNCVNTLIDEKSSLTFVKSRSNIFDWELMPPEHLVREPFFSQILISNAIDLISGITNHTHIPVSNGRILMGVLDETGTLEYGEIYAHIVESDFDYEVEGRVLIFRNPCVLPSDIRVLTAKKSCPGLTTLYTNCLVLPSKGPFSHASECSGGDLDGDLYYVIWDENLVPQCLEVPGEKVIEVKTVESDPLQICNTHESMLEFYCDYVSKNQLGIIANAHLAVADQFNIRHPKSIELAKYVTAETDAPKKGYSVGRIPSKLLPSQYPDFMQKFDKPSYRSETILGELYRQSKPILEVFLEKQVLTIRNLKFSITNEHSTENCYSAYCYEIKQLLHSFDLESEVDLFSGTTIWKNDYLSTYKQHHQLRQNVLGTVKIFWRKWKRIFDKWRSDNCNSQKKILEWYRRPKSSPWPVHSFSFLAIPHVNFDECIRKSISQEIHDSTHRWVFYNKMRWLNEWRKRYNIVETVTNKLYGIECHSYGSSVLGLNEEYSDIDLCAADNNFENICKSLKELDQNVQIMKRPHACVTLTCEMTKIEITKFIDGVSKTNSLAETFDENPGFWPALRVLIEWARIARVVKSCGSEGLMTVVSFCHLFIYMATTASQLQIRVEKTPYTLKRFGNWIDSLSDSACGILIYDFLKKLASRDNRLWLSSKMDPLTKEPLIKKDLIKELCKNAEIALSILSVHNGDVQQLFNFCTKKRLYRLDKRYIDPITSTNTSRNLCLKELATVCNPTNSKNLHFQLTERNGIYYVEVSGDHKAFPDVDKGINKIHCKIMNARAQDLCRRKAYHVKNATIILPEFGCGLSSEVSFSLYDGERYNVHHTGLWKSKMNLRNVVDRNSNWKENEYQRYESRFLRQMEFYAEKQRMARKDSRCLRFFGKLCCRIRCGNHYFFHIPESLQNTFETISLLDIEEKVAHMEESLDLERQENIIQEMRNYNSSTLIQSSRETVNDDSLVLMPLHELKQQRLQLKNKSLLPFMSATKNKNVNGVRHSFYTSWSSALNETREFAVQNGFDEVPTVLNDYYTKISVFWRQRELTVSCDKFGIVTEISHRKVRWLSATLNKIEEDSGDDVRIYLESQTPIDDDESCLETVIEYLNHRSVFTETFAKQLEKQKPFPSKPLIPEVFHFNWRFRSMRVITPVLKFVNAENDECVLNEIQDGIFHVNNREFEWFPKHFEFEMSLCMDKISPEKLCKKSYDLGLKIFDHSKWSCR